MSSESDSESATKIRGSVADRRSTVQEHPGASTNQIATPGAALASRSKYVGNYELLQTIGEGSFAKVKLAVHRLTRQKVAIKIIDKAKLPDEYSLKNIHREAQIMRMIDHPNIIQLFEVMETKKNLFLVLEYAGKGELLDYIVAHGKLKEEDAKKFVRQMISALDHAHSMNVVHRDLKAENLLLDEHMSIKISDFGLSNVYDNKGYLTTSCGSPVYSAPELIEGKKYVGPEVDAWSLGINVYAMVVGDLPFADANLTALYESILRGKYEVPDYVSSACKDFISKLLVVNPKKRATVSQMRDHPWLSEATSFLGPVSDEPELGLRPRTEKDLEPEIMDQIEQMGFDKKQAAQSIISGKFNQAAGTYYLIAYAKQKALLHGESADTDISNRKITIDSSGLVSEPADDDETLRSGGGDVTSEELARVLFQVEGIRGAAAKNDLSGRVGRDGIGSRYSRRDTRDNGSPSTEKRGGNAAANAAPSAMGSQISKSSTTDIEVKNGKSVIKRVRARGNVVGSSGSAVTSPVIGASTTATNQQQQIHHLSARPGKDAEDIPTPRVSEVSGLPRIPQPRQSRTQESKVVNLPSISGATGNTNTENTSTKTSALRTTLAPTMDLTTLAERPGGSAKPHATRRLVKNSPIPIDDSLYLSKDQDNDGGDPVSPGPMGPPRTIRFAFNCVATITVTPETFFDRLRNTLDRNDVEWRHEAFLCECEWGDIKFEIEICKLPRVRSYGVRLKRSSGDVWEYKKLTSRLVNELDVTGL